MLKQKKYLLIAILFLISMITVLSRVSFWEKQIYFTVKKKIEPKGWNLISGELSGNFMNTIVMENILFEGVVGEQIEIDKISLNLGIISSLFGDNVFDLVAVEGLKFSYEEVRKSGGKTMGNNLSFDLPFHIKSLFINILVGPISEALKLTSSRSFSIMVCSRLATIFSTI